MKSTEIITILQTLGFKLNDTGFCGCSYDNEHGDNGWQHGDEYITTDNKIIWLHECEICHKFTIHCTDN
jgi:hypothetical protein